MNNQDKEDSATLEILQAIEIKSDVTQRHIADRLGIALGLANSYLKRCVHKGLVKIQQAPANRYFYYLTPKGFAEKSRLTGQYLILSFDFYRQTSESMRKVFDDCLENKYRRIILCGVSELAEIASIRIQEYDLEIIGTYDPSTTKKEFLNLPVWSSLDKLDSFDVCLLTSLRESQDLYDLLVKHVAKELILVPSILGVMQKSVRNMK